MMRPIVAVTLLIVASLVLAQAGPNPDRQKVAQILGRLEAADYRDREAATREIELLPASALPLIEKLLSSGTLSPEVALRIEAKLDVLRRNAAASIYELSLRREWQWNRETALQAYDGGGNTNFKWDPAAHEAIVLHIQPRFTDNFTPKDNDRIMAAFQKAFDAGCDDPLVKMFYLSRYRLQPGYDRERACTLINDALGRMTAKKYPAFRRAGALLCRAEVIRDSEGGRISRPSPAGLRQITHDLDSALGLLPEVSADSDLPHSYLYDLSFRILEEMMATPGLDTQPSKVVSDDPEKDFSRVFSVIKSLKLPANGPGRFEASFHVGRAVTLRRGVERGPIYDPDDNEATKARLETLRAIRRHLEAARPLIEAAQQKDPDDPVPATLMLQCLLELNWSGVDGAVPANNPGTDRDLFELWFARAMKAYPNNLRACQLKRAFLQAIGAEDDMFAFARLCAAKYGQQSRIPFILVNAHLSVAAKQSMEEYFAQDVPWDEVSQVYTRYLAIYPNAYLDRSLFANLACHGGRWRTADAQFKALGNNAVEEVFAGKATLDYLRKKAVRLAEEP